MSSAIKNKEVVLLAIGTAVVFTLGLSWWLLSSSKKSVASQSQPKESISSPQVAECCDKTAELDTVADEHIVTMDVSSTTPFYDKISLQDNSPSSVVCPAESEVTSSMSPPPSPMRSANWSSAGVQVDYSREVISSPTQLTVAQKIAAIEKKKKPNGEDMSSPPRAVKKTDITINASTTTTTTGASTTEPYSPVRVLAAPSDMFSPGGTRKIDPVERDKVRVSFCNDLVTKIDASKGSTQILMAVMTRDLARTFYDGFLAPKLDAHEITHSLILPGFKKVTSSCNAHCIVGTPDMLEKEIFKRQYIDTKDVRILVVDETHDLMRVTGLTPTKKQVCKLRDSLPDECSYISFSF